jgi:hypothetical protein
MDTTEIAISLDIQEKMMLDEYDSVSIKLLDFNSNDIRMQLIKQVETIWNTSQMYNSPISTNDSLILYDIACLDPLVNGSAVYQARAIIDWDGFSTQNENKSVQSFNDSNDIKTTCLTIFPNPSNGEFKIESTEIMKLISIYDLKGLKLVEYPAETMLIDIVSNLKTGIYILKVSFENDQFETHKISIH